MSKVAVSKALMEVWEWKEACYQEVKGLNLRNAINYRLKKANESLAQLGIERLKLPDGTCRLIFTAKGVQKRRSGNRNHS